MTRNISHDSEKWRLLTPLIKDDNDKSKYKIYVKNAHFKQIRAFVFAKTECLPRYVKRRLLRHYTVIFNKKLSKGENNEKFANIWLRDVVKPVNEIIDNCPLTLKQLRSDEEVEKLAMLHSDKCIEAISVGAVYDDYLDNLIFVYKELTAYCNESGIRPPYMLRVDTLLESQEENKALIAPVLECALLRLSCQKWWLNRLKRIKNQVNEHILIAIGEVKKTISPYISAQSLSEWKSQQKANRQYLEAMELVKSCVDDNGNEYESIVSLKEMADKSSANPRHRFTELMVRCKGLENLAIDDGYMGLFLTLTAPSKYHRTSKGKNNPKWLGCTPKTTQKYLVNIWSRIRAKLARLEIPFYGVRVVEPHHDGTPHWHMLIFVAPTFKHDLLAVCKGYALAVDGDENGALKHRFTVEEIDPNKGSATGYIAKYLSKNINGEYIEKGTSDHRRAHNHDVEDWDSGKSASEGAQRATAWASRWNIRQFQFFGSESVTVYRETRRLKDAVENAEVEKIRLAVESSDDKGKWYAFTKAMKESRISLSKELKVNDYAECIESINGLKSASGFVQTRFGEYELRKRGSGSPWSPVNKCTLSHSEASKLSVYGFNPEEIELLQRGCKVKMHDRLSYAIRSNQLIEYRK